LGGLWIRLPPPTPFLDRAQDRLEGQLEYVGRLSAEPLEYLAALAVTGYVNGRVSAPLYGYRKTVTSKDLPVGDSLERTAELALEMGAGICTQSMAAAMTLYERLGVTARRLDVMHPSGGHTTTEVWYDGDWHWFDPTFGYFYRDPAGDPSDVYSLTEVMQLADPEAAKVVAESRLWAQVTEEAGAEAGNGLEITGLPVMWVVAGDGTVIYQRGRFDS
jgi:hypothetical protein